MRTIRLGILGAGAMGARIATGAQASGRFDVVGVADPDLSRATAVAESVGSVPFGSQHDLQDSNAIEAIYIGLPHHLHLEACLTAAAADLHVLLDKPMCNTTAEADLILTEASRTDRVWMMGFSYRFRSEWRRARTLVAEGWIGEPRFVNDVIVEASTSTPQWYWNTASGGGVLQLQSHHCFDRLAWVLDSHVTEITCVSNATGEQAETTAHILATTQRGATASIALAFATTYKGAPDAYFILQGDAGQLRINENRVLQGSGSHGVLLEHHDHDDWLQNELHAFADTVEAGAVGTASLRDGVAAVQCARAAADSARLGTPVRLP